MRWKEGRRELEVRVEGRSEVDRLFNKVFHPWNPVILTVKTKIE